MNLLTVFSGLVREAQWAAESVVILPLRGVGWSKRNWDQHRVYIRELCVDAKMQSWVVTGWHGMWTLMILYFPSLSDQAIIISLSGSDTNVREMLNLGLCWASIVLTHSKIGVLARRRVGSGPFAGNPPFVSFGSATTDLRWKLHVAAQRARLRRTAYGKCFRLWERPNSSKPPYGKSFGRTPYTLRGVWS